MEDQEIVKQELLNHAMEGNWGDVLDMYKNHPWAQRAYLTRSGETALHLAVFESTEDTVEKLVDLVDAEEEKAQQGESSSAFETMSPLMIANDRGNTPLHLAALIGKVGMCMVIARKHGELVGLRNIAGETPLFLAALRGKKDAFLYLHGICGGPAGTHNHFTRRADGQTILHVAISGEYFDLAYHIICECDHLIYYVDDNGYTPLHVLASKPAVFATSLHLGPFSRFIYYCLHVEKLITEERKGDTPQNQGKRSCNIKLMIIKFISKSAMLFIDGLVWLFGSRELKKMRAKKEKNIWSLEIMNLLLEKSSSHKYDSSGGCNPGPFSIPNRIEYFPKPDQMDCFSELERTNQRSRDLINNIWLSPIMNLQLLLESPLHTNHTSTGRHPEREKGYRMDYFSNPDRINQRRETPILLAAKNGITKMVMQILKLSPAAILDRDSANKNIVHLAVENRRTQLYEKLVSKINFYDSAFRAVDNKGNSVLHLAATLGDHRLFPFGTLQMQWEIKWYKYVKDSVPRDFFISRNNENMTPKEVFRKSHEVLVKEGGKWLISTSNSCSVVATVVTTVAFATTATIPGGMKEGSSTPNLEHDPGFIVFAISSLIALSFSITSVIAFLAILTPRHSPKDFEKNLPKKLLLALTYLFISLAAICWFVSVQATSFW